MLKLNQKQDCCGCGACAQVCPQDCISMTADEEGFLYPKIDESRCIQCRKCEAACPILTRQAVPPLAPEAYAAYANDDQTRLVSSSGGIFSLLALWVLRQNGVVFGAAFAEDHSVHHIMIDSEKDLPLLQGSKYVQSRIENTYTEARKQLEQGKTVLFSGVACQIAGLRAFLKKDWDNLYTVDVLCHGVPSPKVWQQYLAGQKQIYGSEISRISFRNKAEGWKQFSMELVFRNGETYRKTLHNDPYMRYFLSDICLRPSCYSCRFKELPHPSDLTLGDAWGIEGWMPEMDDDRGASLVFVNTPAGQVCWEAIQDSLRMQSGNADVMLPPSADSRHSVVEHINRSRFLRAVNKDASQEQLQKLLHRSFFLRIISFTRRKIKKLLNQ